VASRYIWHGVGRTAEGRLTSGCHVSVTQRQIHLITEREPTRLQRCRCAQMLTIQVRSDLEAEEKWRFVNIPAPAATTAIPSARCTRTAFVGSLGMGRSCAALALPEADLKPLIDGPAGESRRD
jgi:hypothetical protein